MNKYYLLCITIIFLFIHHIIYSADLYSFQAYSSFERITQNRVYIDKFANWEQVAAFQMKKNAERFVEKLKKEGFEAVIQSDISKDKKRVYGVFAKKFEEPLKDTISSGEVKQDATSEKVTVKDKPVVRGRVSEELKEPSKDALSASETRKETVLTPLLTEEKPIGSVRKRPSADVFGNKGGYLHPFLSITEYYTDNVFNTRNETKGDLVTIISPGIWLAVPHVYEKLLSIDTSNIAPGGFNLSRFTPESFKRYQTYLFYNADIEQFSKYSSENTTSHKVDGLFQYNLRGGLSIDLTDQFLSSYDIRGTGVSTELDKFKTNLTDLILTYNVGEKIKFRVDYSNFHVDYDASRNDFRDRDDNAIFAYIFYKFQPKTSLFIEYEFIDIEYKKNILSNSEEHHYFGGLQWDITAKSKGSIKAGYGTKYFNGSAIGDSNDFILEAQIDHKFTPKTSLIIKASRKTNETNISTTDFIRSNNIEVEYVQRLTGKITGDVDLSYTNDKYKGGLIFGSKTKEREDNLFSGAFALQYKFKEWLQTDAGYIYTRRDSNFPDFNYTNNIVFIKITGSL